MRILSTRSQPRASFLRVVGLLVVAPLGLEACDREGEPTPRLAVDDRGLELGLSLPSLRGWAPDPSVELVDTDAGGDALVLQRPHAPVGSPKIAVNIAPKAARPLRPAAFLDQNLRAMGSIEQQSGMRITRVSQKPLAIGPRRASLVRHEYTLGRGATQLAFTQLAAIVVIDGRGITATAVGRTELFSPLEDQITRILTGIEIAATASPTKIVEVETKTLPTSPDEVEPVNLGTVGGK